MIRIALLLAVFLAPPAAALDLQDLRDQTREMVLDTGPRLRFSTTTIDRFINEAQRIAIADAKVIRKSIQVQAVIGTTYYAMPSDFMQIQRVTYQHLELPEITPIALSNKAGRKWQVTQAFPTHYFLNFSSRTLLGLYPVPGSSSDVDQIRVEYYAQATDLTSASDHPFGGITELIPYHYMLAFYAAFRLSALDGRSDLAGLYRLEFYEAVVRMRREGVNRPSYRPGAQPAIRSTRIGP